MALKCSEYLYDNFAGIFPKKCYYKLKNIDAAEINNVQHKILTDFL